MSSVNAPITTIEGTTISMAQLRAFLTTVGGAVAYVGFCSLVGRLRILPAKLSRKLMHIGESLGCSRLASRSWAHMPKDFISALQRSAKALQCCVPSCPPAHCSTAAPAGTGPLYMLCWPLYTASRASPWLCALVPLLASTHFALVGRGMVRDQSLVASVTVRDALRRGCKQHRLSPPSLQGEAVWQERSWLATLREPPVACKARFVDYCGVCLCLLWGAPGELCCWLTARALHLMRAAQRRPPGTAARPLPVWARAQCGDGALLAPQPRCRPGAGSAVRWGWAGGGGGEHRCVPAAATQQGQGESLR